MAAMLAQQLLFAVFPLAMVYAAISDLMTMTISNRLTLILAAAFVVLSPVTGMDFSTFGLHWAAGGSVLAVAFLCFAFGWIGGGDAKLAVGHGAVAGLEQHHRIHRRRLDLRRCADCASAFFPTVGPACLHHSSALDPAAAR